MLKRRMLRVACCVLFWVVGCQSVEPEVVVMEVVAEEEEVVVEPTATATAVVEAKAAESEYGFERDLYPVLAELGAGWTKIEPGGETRCALDTPFAFWVRPGTVNKLLLYFEGGGGCWDAQTCAAGSGWYDSDVGVDEDPSRRNGVFDMDNPENPFQEYHAVFVPSCTGDVHWGTATHVYSDGEGEDLTVYHHGFINGQAALAWAYDNVLEPESVFVTGCSAGSVGSVVHVDDIINQYPEAEVTQLGDSLAFLFGRPVDLTEWGVQEALPVWMMNIGAESVLMREFVAAVANRYPQFTFSQYNTEVDNVQVRYFAANADAGAEEAFTADLMGHLGDIHTAAPNFRSYTADGSQHCILPRTDFYRREVNGVRVVDWVRDLAEGVDVENVVCESCDLEIGE